MDLPRALCSGTPGCGPRAYGQRWSAWRATGSARRHSRQGTQARRVVVPSSRACSGVIADAEQCWHPAERYSDHHALIDNPGRLRAGSLRPQDVAQGESGGRRFVHRRLSSIWRVNSMTRARRLAGWREESSNRFWRGHSPQESPCRHPQVTALYAVRPRSSFDVTLVRDDGSAV